ncbi:protein-export chaperone SecB [Amaricoccus tamworthensis]|uniref:protein-export chaperone SecB n=1 Tax=Amaricoccus tamworthensis TaxID=57002 RepID=UPI003C7B24D2
MAEESNGAAPEAASVPQAPRLQIVTQFIRDMSFENIAVQKGIPAEGKPDIKVQVNLDAKKRPEDRYEVAIKINATSSVADNPVFILELEYAGLFHVENVPDEQLHPFLMIECPRQLFPYLRRIIADITHDGGYPPLNLEPIDFLALYRNNIARQAEAAKKAQEAQPAGTA